MKVLAIVLTLAAVALATPTGTNPPKCKPATYACATNAKTGQPGWQVCDVSGNWVVSHPLILIHCAFRRARKMMVLILSPIFR